MFLFSEQYYRRFAEYFNDNAFLYQKEISNL